MSGSILIKFRERFSSYVAAAFGHAKYQIHTLFVMFGAHGRHRNIYVFWNVFGSFSGPCLRMVSWSTFWWFWLPFGVAFGTQKRYKLSPEWGLKQGPCLRVDKWGGGPTPPIVMLLTAEWYFSRQNETSYGPVCPIPGWTRLLTAQASFPLGFRVALGLLSYGTFFRFPLDLGLISSWFRFAFLLILVWFPFYLGLISFWFRFDFLLI